MKYATVSDVAVDVLPYVVAHGLRRTAQTRAENAVTRAAMAVRTAGSRMIISLSDSKGALYVP